MAIEIYDVNPKDYESIVYADIRKDINKLLKRTGKNKQKQIKVRGIAVMDPDARKIFTGKETSCILPWKTNYRGKVVLSTPIESKSHLKGKAFAQAKIYTITHEDGAYRWHFRKIHIMKPFRTDVYDGFFPIMLLNGWE
jgi:hypothetical protein